MEVLLAVAVSVLFFTVVFLNQKNIDQKDTIKEMEARDPKNIEKKRLEEKKRLDEKEKRDNEKLIDENGL